MNTRRVWSAWVVVLMIAVGPATVAAGADHAARTERLVAELERAMQDMHVPGMAVAIVHEDEVVLSRGFGQADLEAKQPVTEETIFAIGSSSKAFTATLIGMLVDEGLMDWDDPVSKHLPAFVLPVESEDESATVSVRDLLSHRTGFTRMSLLWAAGALSPDEVLTAALQAEPYAPFRETFLYNNVMFLAAGTAAGRAAGADWQTLIEERFFVPLGMNDSTTSVAAAQRDPRLAKGYAWDEEAETFEHLPMRALDSIAPAGAINSNVRDMAQWVRLQLGRGAVNGTRLVSENAIEETWAPHIDISPGVSYGLGWMIREHDGRTVIEHGGNIDGFAAEIALMPEENLGVVMLANVSATPLQTAVMKIVWDAFLEEQQPAGDDGEEDFEPYVGEYIGTFAHFTDAVFKVFVQNDRLAVHVPGQMAYELEPPDEDGKRHFVLTDDVAISFERDADGRVIMMRMHQAGMTFELPRKGVELQPEIDRAELAKYLGRYDFAAMGIVVEALVQNGRLAVDVPGQMVYELHPPDAEGKWVFRATPEIAVRFDEGPDGEIASLTLFQAGQEFVMPRLEGPVDGNDPGADEALPTVDELMQRLRKASGAARIADLGAVRMSGTIRFVHQGASGRATTTVDGPCYRMTLDLGRLARIESVVTADGGWSDSSLSPFELLAGKRLQQARQAHPLAILDDWRAMFDSIELVREEEIDGRRTFVLRLTQGDVPPITRHLDAQSGLFVKEQAFEHVNSFGSVPITREYDDYRPVNGVMIPHRMVMENVFNGRVVIEIERIETGVDLPPDAFDPPADAHRERGTALSP